jgi:hypothetical protein
MIHTGMTAHQAPLPAASLQVLLQLNLHETREFFAAFFSLSAFHWHGFLSARWGARHDYGLCLRLVCVAWARLLLLLAVSPHTC